MTVGTAISRLKTSRVQSQLPLVSVHKKLPSCFIRHQRTLKWTEWTKNVLNPSCLRHLLAYRSQERENERVTRKSFQCFFVQWANRPDQVNIKTVSTSSFLISVSSRFNFSSYPHLAQKDYDDSVTPTPIYHDCISKTVRREILRRLQRSSSFPLKKINSWNRKKENPDLKLNEFLLQGSPGLRCP